MVNKQILFDLMNGLLGPKTEADILNKNIPIFVKKLNCFMASVVKVENKSLNIKYMIPYVFNKNLLWNKIYTVAKNNDKSEEEINNYGSYEYQIDGKYFYKFKIEDYGFLILGKNNPFENIFRYELFTIIVFMSKSLALAVERKKLQDSEKEISIEKNLLKTIIDNIPIHVYAKNTKLERILSNRVELDYIGARDEKDIYGKKDEDIFSFHHKNWEEEDKKILEGDTLLNQEISYSKYVDEDWFLSSKIPLKNTTNEITGLVGILISISDQKKLQKELLEALDQANIASKAKEQFLANMSHEIRTPLNIITGMLRELKKGKLSTAQHKLIESSNTATNHLLSIVNNVLDISKIEAGEFKIQYQHFRLKDIINEITYLVKNQLRDQNTTLKIDYDEEIEPIIIGDKTYIIQILLNIIGNSIKFTKNGKIKLACICKGDSQFDQIISFEIEDNGIGMSKEYLKDFFKKFQQEDASNTNNYGGTGLGMHITSELIHLMRGSISVDSTKGKGTKICFELPFKKGHENKIKKENITDLLKLDEKITILVVDDNEMNRLVASNTLEIINAEIFEASNGQEALDLLKVQKFDLILMDLQMPVLNGIETTKIIRNELHIQIPIIALTANALKSEIENCFNIGMNDYITKPFEEKEIINKILKNYLNHKRLYMVDEQIVSKKKAKKSNSLYNLEGLNKISRGNKDFELKMIKIFIKTISESIELFKIHLQEKDIEKINKLAHKIKPSIQNLSISSITQDILDIEKIEKIDFSLESKLMKVMKVLDTVIQELKIQFKIS